MRWRRFPRGGVDRDVGARYPARVRGASLIPKLVAEAVGTYFLVFAGCGAVVADVHFEAGLGTLGIALAFGLVVMAMVQAIGHISGAHINPAVTVAFAALGRLPRRQVIPYVAAQCVGAIAAAGTLRLLLAPEGALGATVPAGEVGQSLGLEIVLSFLLMFVITAVATDARAVGQIASLAIGGTVALCALFGGPVSGASMNPARSLGPALFSGELAPMWIYVVGPVVGALAGAFTYQLTRCDREGEGGPGGCC